MGKAVSPAPKARALNPKSSRSQDIPKVALHRIASETHRQSCHQDIFLLTIIQENA